MGLGETSNFSVFTFSSASNLKVSTHSYSNSLNGLNGKVLQTDDITLQHSILYSCTFLCPCISVLLSFIHMFPVLLLLYLVRQTCWWYFFNLDK